MLVLALQLVFRRNQLKFEVEHDILAHQRMSTVCASATREAIFPLLEPSIFLMHVILA